MGGTSNSWFRSCFPGEHNGEIWLFLPLSVHVFAYLRVSVDIHAHACHQRLVERSWKETEEVIMLCGFDPWISGERLRENHCHYTPEGLLLFTLLLSYTTHFNTERQTSPAAAHVCVPGGVMSDILRSPSDLREWECPCVCVCVCVCACQRGGSEAEGCSWLKCCFLCGFQLTYIYWVRVLCLIHTFLTRTPVLTLVRYNFR